MSTPKFYVGPRGVDHVVIDEMKTYSGQDIVEVHYDGGYKELMTKKSYELVSSPEPSDFTMVRNKKLNAISAELFPLIANFIALLAKPADEIKKARTEFLQATIAVIAEYDLKVSEIEALLNPIAAEIQSLVNIISSELDNTFNRATNYLWTKDDSQFIPGTNMMMERTLLEATKINKTIPDLAPKVDVAKPEEPKAE